MAATPSVEVFGALRGWVAGQVEDFSAPTRRERPHLQLAADGMTMVIVTHETKFARDVADRIVFMDGVVVVEEARPEQFFTQPAHARARSFLRLVEHQGPVPPPREPVRTAELHPEGA